MALEVRSSDDDKEDSKSSQNVEKDARPYRGSFNPFAALAIGITGIAMAAHHQTYLFQVQIHTLWGNLLALYAVFRCFTYIFVWMAPPKTIRPSRPPTEAVASFFLTAGGLTFMSSTEQIGFWAMRSGRDDVMMFLNLIVALTFLCFTWVFGVLSFRKYMINKNSKMSGVSKSVASHGTQASHKFNPV
ncbi:hypothetical protein FRC02_011609 [Tulasnella sp. 418]|nr:hypothetical protein FRC02_011609 [Tulasnella sp. 418]